MFDEIPEKMQKLRLFHKKDVWPLNFGMQTSWKMSFQNANIIRWNYNAMPKMSVHVGNVLELANWIFLWKDWLNRQTKTTTTNYARHYIPTPLKNVFKLPYITLTEVSGYDEAGAIGSGLNSSYLNISFCWAALTPVCTAMSSWNLAKL